MRYHLHVAESADGAPTFQTQEANSEQEASATATMLAARGFIVWLYEHDHDGDTYRELGMFVGDRFMPTRSNGDRYAQRHHLR